MHDETDSPVLKRPIWQQVMRTSKIAGTSYRVGKVAYEAYSDCAGGRSLVSGEPLPMWAQMSTQMREAWHAAADAVWNDCVALHSSRESFHRELRYKHEKKA